MELRDLGRTGLRVSALGFGCGSVGGLMVRGEPAEQRRAIARAIEGGIRYFDTAPSYGEGRSEENLGRVLGELGSDAAGVVVGTKLRVDPSTAGNAASVRRAVWESLEASLRRLRRERVHLIQLHNRLGPDGASGDLTAGDVIGPVADALAEVRAAGLAEHAGITGTGDADAVRRVLESGRIETAQIYFNALNPSAGWAGRAPAGGHDFAGAIDVAASRGVGVIVIRPLAAGAVAGAAARHVNAGTPGTGAGIAGERYGDDVARALDLARLADELGVEGPVELAFRFALAKPGVSTVLVGFSDGTQLEDALRWTARGPLAPDAVQRVLDLHGPAAT